MRSIIDSWEITQDVQYEIVDSCEIRQDVENNFVLISNSVAEFYFLLIKIIKKNENLRNKLNEFENKLSEPFRQQHRTRRTPLQNISCVIRCLKEFDLYLTEVDESFAWWLMIESHCLPKKTQILLCHLIIDRFPKFKPFWKNHLHFDIIPKNKTKCLKRRSIVDSWEVTQNVGFHQIDEIDEITNGFDEICYLMKKIIIFTENIKKHLAQDRFIRDQDRISLSSLNGFLEVSEVYVTRRSWEALQRSKKYIERLK